MLFISYSIYLSVLSYSVCNNKLDNNFILTSLIHTKSSYSINYLVIDSAFNLNLSDYILFILYYYQDL
jgi:hypothetical protein